MLLWLVSPFPVTILPSELNLPSIERTTYEFNRAFRSIIQLKFCLSLKCRLTIKLLILRDNTINGTTPSVLNFK